MVVFYYEILHKLVDIVVKTPVVKKVKGLGFSSHPEGLPPGTCLTLNFRIISYKNKTVLFMSQLV